MALGIVCVLYLPGMYDLCVFPHPPLARTSTVVIIILILIVIIMLWKCYHIAIMSQCSVALLLCIVDLICVGSSVTYVCVRRNCFRRILRLISR